MTIGAPTFFLIVLFLISVAAGFLGSLLGLGGGMIVIPALTLLFHVDIHYAFGASIVSVIATSCGAAAAYVKEKITNIRIAMFLEVATTVGAITGATLLAVVRTPALFIIFGIVLLLSFVPVIRRRQEAPIKGTLSKQNGLSRRLRLEGKYYDEYLDREVSYEASKTPIAFGMMYIAGIISGLLGVGSGPFKVLSMDLAMRLPIKVSTTTSNFMIGVTAAASAGIYFARGYINPFVAAPVALGVLVGATLGARWLPRAKNILIRRIFAIVLVIVAVQMIFSGLGINI
ncbi:MAG: permease [Dehalococcoidia bacterium CG2_30_46_9]|nr:MAG: permease [Dehalococcoidia bacterium CG2_30_46_9]